MIISSSKLDLYTYVPVLYLQLFMRFGLPRVMIISSSKLDLYTYVPVLYLQLFMRFGLPRVRK